ncbi:MAG TPA: DUF1385 domain-containing protein [Ktedonobacterales bacterium]|nr:DUF1385 domain-containing protein [Ktedonobacterales bacterium]
MAKFYYGGQAVIEGVMMRGRHSAAVAVREPTGGIVLHEEELDSALYRSPVARWPFVRGVVLLWEMLILGTRMMLFAAATAMPTQQPESAGSNAVVAPTTAAGRSRVTEVADTKRDGGAMLVVSLVVSLSIAIGVFFLLPVAAVGAAHQWLGTGWLSLVVEGLLRLALLVGYLALIGRLAEIKRVFAYHGAEHKAINAFEAERPLDTAHVRAASRVHTRCGTGFLLIVVVVSIFVFAALGTPPLPLRIISRVALVPVIAAISYELLRLGAAYYRFRIVRWLVAPSLALQGLTTREPDDGQIECAITALERVLRRDGVKVLESVA